MKNSLVVISIQIRHLDLLISKLALFWTGKKQSKAKQIADKLFIINNELRTLKFSCISFNKTSTTSIIDKNQKGKYKSNRPAF